MSRETQVPAIPDVRDDNELAVLRAIKNTLDVREGRIGDALDQYVTLRDLTDIGVLTLGVGSPLTNGTIVPVVIPGSDPDGYDPSSDFIPPPQPAGLTASGAFSNVILAWTAPNYRNHAYTEIWRSQTNTLGTAVRVGTTVANVYADPAIEGQTYYYWIRFVSQADVVGAYNATSGTQASTATSPTTLLNVLSGQITEAQLSTTLGTRINLIDGPVSLAGSVAAQVYAEQQARIAADTSLGSSITTLTNTTNTQASQITSLTTRTTTAETNITNLQSTSTSQASSITSLTTRMGTAESNITSLQTTTSTQATSITSLTTRVGTAETNITNLQTSDASQATSITTLTTTVGGHTTTLSTQATSISGLQAQYTVKIDSNGYVTGYGLASTAVNGTPTSTFIVRADDFSIANPTGPSIPPAMPFIVRTTVTTINGVSVPVGVYITDTFIQNGTITNAKIGDAAIDNAKIANLDAAKITTGFLDAARISVGSLDAKIANLDAAIITSGTLSTARIADATITSAKIASLDGAKINAGTITTDRIQVGAVTAASSSNTGDLFFSLATNTSSSWQSVTSITFTCSGPDVPVYFTATLSASYYSSSSSETSVGFELRCYIDGYNAAINTPFKGLRRQVNVPTITAGATRSGNAVITTTLRMTGLPAGSHTFYVDGVFSSASSSGTTPQLYLLGSAIVWENKV